MLSCGPFQGHPTFDCYAYFLLDFFSGLLKGVDLGLYQRSWVKVAVKMCGWDSSLGRYCLSAMIFSGGLTKDVQLLCKLDNGRV